MSVTLLLVFKFNNVIKIIRILVKVRVSYIEEHANSFKDLQVVCSAYFPLCRHDNHRRRVLE